jgi:hypothetical protein
MMMFNRNAHLDHEREAVRKGDDIKANIEATYDKSGLSRRPGLGFRKSPSPPAR